MIGQQKLLRSVDRMAQGINGFPRFTILCGPTGSGKKLLATYIANRLNAQLITSRIKVDDIREVINLAYKQSQPTVYLIPDVDKMSVAAKNALLKVTEEPPRQAYFVMTITSMSNTLATLQSRGCLIRIDPYTVDQLLQYCRVKGYELDEKEKQIVGNLCTVPGEVDLLLQYNVNDFYNYVKLVVDNIGKVSGANAFKIGQKLKYKDEDEGWDVFLFMRAIMYGYLDIIETDPVKCRDSIAIVSTHLQQMLNPSVNKSATVDMMILELRGVWVE